CHVDDHEAFDQSRIAGREGYGGESTEGHPDQEDRWRDELLHRLRDRIAHDTRVVGSVGPPAPLPMTGKVDGHTRATEKECDDVPCVRVLRTSVHEDELKRPLAPRQRTQSITA